MISNHGFCSLPGIGWRSQFDTWVKEAIDYKFKYRRLNNILKGVLDADPSAKTLANVNAEDSQALLNYLRSQINKYSKILRNSDIQIENIFDDVLDWKLELKYINDYLKIDYIGLDTYANYFIKYPVHGQETGKKVAEAVKLTNKPVLNLEFAYTTFRNITETLLFPLLGRPNASDMQLEFLKTL